ncbi:hypothetical protein [Streptomyces sp. NPDC091027]|uniref:hypothetical protein n=1 Tax=Streptomyces sp. NPDC091027 TaxID=3365971 RepID=UPI003826D745
MSACAAKASELVDLLVTLASDVVAVVWLATNSYLNEHWYPLQPVLTRPSSVCRARFTPSDPRTIRRGHDDGYLVFEPRDPALPAAALIATVAPWIGALCTVTEGLDTIRLATLPDPWPLGLSLPQQADLTATLDVRHGHGTWRITPAGETGSHLRGDKARQWWQVPQPTPGRTTALSDSRLGMLRFRY